MPKTPRIPEEVEAEEENDRSLNFGIDESRIESTDDLIERPETDQPEILLEQSAPVRMSEVLHAIEEEGANEFHDILAENPEETPTAAAEEIHHKINLMKEESKDLE